MLGCLFCCGRVEGSGWLVGQKRRSRVASHESTIVQIITSPWRRSSLSGEREREESSSSESRGSPLSLVHNAARGARTRRDRRIPAFPIPRITIASADYRAADRRVDRRGAGRSRAGRGEISVCARLYCAVLHSHKVERSREP